MMRNLFVFLVGVMLLCSAFALFSRATWGEPIGIDSLEPVYQEKAAVQGKAAVQEEVRAKKFVLVNEKGTPVGAFRTFEGQPGLMLNGQDKKVRAIFALDRSGGPGFVLFDENGKILAQFAIMGNEPRIVLRDKNKKLRALFALDKDGQPGLALFDGTGKLRAQFDIEGNEPRLVLLDENGKTAFQAPQ